MKRIAVYLLFVFFSTYSFAQFTSTIDVPVFGSYEFQKGIYDDNGSRNVSKGGFGLGFDWFPGKSFVGVYFRGFFEFPFSLDYENKTSSTFKSYKNFSHAWGYKIVIGPSFNIDLSKIISLNIAPAVGVGFSQIQILNFKTLYDVFALESAVLDIPILLDVAIKIRPHKNFFIVAGVNAQYALFKVPIESNTMEGWNTKNIKHLFSVMPYLGVGFRIKETFHNYSIE